MLALQFAIFHEQSQWFLTNGYDHGGLVFAEILHGVEWQRNIFIPLGSSLLDLGNTQISIMMTTKGSSF